MSYAHTCEPHILIDKNKLRGSAAQQVQSRAVVAGVGIALPDVVLVEMANAVVRQSGVIDTSKFAKHFEQDFQAWTTCPQLLSITCEPGAVLAAERNNGSRALSILDQRTTRILRNMLSQMAAGNMRSIVEMGSLACERVAEQYADGKPLNVNARYEATRNIVGSMQVECSLLQAVREEFARPDAPLIELGRYVFGKTIERLMRNCLLTNGFGYTQEIAEALLAVPSFTYFSQAVFFADTILYRAFGNSLGRETNKDRLLNQLLDLEYMAYGLCCSAFDTDESRQRRLAAGLRAAAAERW